MDCKICGKRLKKDEENLCHECHEFYAWKYDENGIEKVLEDYEVQENAGKKQE